MGGLGSLLLFAVFFYLMMRMGCGAHNIHGGHGDTKQMSHENINHTDPVCGMQVDPGKGYGMMHGGKLHRFCSRKCLDSFESDPSKYLKA